MKPRSLFRSFLLLTHLLVPCFGGEPSSVVADTPDELEAFFTEQKPGTFLQLNLRSGNHVEGRLIQYDDYYDTLWIRIAGKNGVLDRKSYRLSTVISAQVAKPSDTLPAASASAPDVQTSNVVITPE